MRTRMIGGTEVSAIGLGAMPLSIENRPDERRAVATIHAALDAGITIIDTADSYHWYAGEVGHNERLIARALASYPGDASDVLVATKGGRGRPGDGTWTVDGHPDQIRRACDASLKRLGLDAIGLYYLHKPDPSVPFADSVGALRDLLDDGKITLAGVSNVDTDQIRTAREILDGRLAAVQNEFSPAVRRHEPERLLCARLGIAFVPWSPLGGISRSSLDPVPGPRPAPPGAAYSGFHTVASRRGLTPQRVCLAWLLSLSPTVVPIPGASRVESIRDSARAADLILSADDLALLPGVAPVHPTDHSHATGHSGDG